MHGKPLQGPIAPAVPFKTDPTGQSYLAPGGQPGVEFVFTENGGNLFIGKISAARLELSVNPELTKRRIYAYMFISADSTVTVQMNPEIQFFYQGGKVGALPLYFSNTDLTTNAILFNRSAPNFADLNAGGDQMSNSIDLTIFDRITGVPNGVPANEGTTAELAPYELDVRIDRIVIPPWQTTSDLWKGRIWLGCLSIKS